jgi:hypothetical protein
MGTNACSGDVRHANRNGPLVSQIAPQAQEFDRPKILIRLISKIVGYRQRRSIVNDYKETQQSRRA